MDLKMLFVTLAVLIILGLLALVRLSPTDPAQWHTDPRLAPVGQPGGVAVLPDGGDLTSPRTTETPQAALARFDAIAMATPRTKRIAGDVDSGKITYETRSLVWGFPDYTTVLAEVAEGGTVLVIHARLRFGKADLGVNRARVERWLAAWQG